MSLDFDKLKEKEHDGHSWWVSYSDLFLVLSTVFLLLYVVSSLRNGSTGVQQFYENQELAKRNEALESQIKVYDTLKGEELAKQNDDEQAVYGELMDKLTLLKDEARDEKENLQRQAKENEKKEFALNKYQALVRNIVNANVLAKAQIHRRDKMIVTKDAQLSESEKLIAQNESTIDKIERDLEQKIDQLNKQQKQAKITKTELSKRIAKLKQDSQERIQSLEAKNNEVAQELNVVRSDLNETSANLNQAQGQVAAVSREKSQLEQQLEATKAGYQGQIAGLKSAHDAALAKERSAFTNELARQTLSAEERARKLGEFTARAQAKARELEGQISGLSSKIRDTEGQLASAEKGRSRALATVDNLKKENQEISGDLKKAREMLEAKQALAKQIRENFKKAGIGAEVDEKTGDVTLAFGDDYFESGSSSLSPSMQKRLEKFIPQYTAGLFKDGSTADKIANVEIIGFASSTYKGKYVPPTSLKPEDQDAVNFNLKLSFSRANAIFKHIFDTKKLKYQHQKELLPLVKVVGRGFLPEGVEERDIPDGISEKEFCSKFNCKRAQRVIIKFNLKE